MVGIRSFPIGSFGLIFQGLLTAFALSFFFEGILRLGEQFLAHKKITIDLEKRQLQSPRKKVPVFFFAGETYNVTSSILLPPTFSRCEASRNRSSENWMHNCSSCLLEAPGCWLMVGLKNKWVMTTDSMGVGDATTICKCNAYIYI